MSKPNKKSTVPEPPVAAIERRKFARTPTDEKPTYLWISLDDRVIGQMKNESPGGLAVLASREHEFDFEVDFQIRVELEHRQYRMARVVHVSDYDEDRLIVGVSWEGEARPTGPTGSA